MAKTTTTVTDAQRELASRIRAICSPIMGPQDEMTEASETLKVAAEKVKNTGRLAIALEISQLSHAESWKGNDVAIACEYARSLGNADDKTAKTLNTVISEMRLFANPKVRALIPALHEACHTAWENEAADMACADPEDKGSVPTPVRNYAPRLYHLLAYVTRAVKDDKLEVYNADDIVWWAKINDPAINPANIAKKVKSLLKQLDVIRGVYHVDDLDAASDALREVDEKRLEAGLTRPVHVRPGHVAPALAPVHTHAGHARTGDAPTHDAPVRDAPVRDAPVRDAPVRDARATAARDAPVHARAPEAEPEQATGPEGISEGVFDFADVLDGTNHLATLANSNTGMMLAAD